jgi:asparagine synthase (glutamine-hydrolysing)
MFVTPYLHGLFLSGDYARLFQEFRVFPQAKASKLLFEIAWRQTPALIRRAARRVNRAVSRSRNLFAHANGPPGLLDSIEKESLRGLRPLDAILLRSHRFRILPNWLRMEDRVSMAHGVESRLPFMDYRLVELAFQLDDTMKLNRGYTKYVLRQAMKNLLPESIVSDQRKRRFATPFARWLRHDWRSAVEDVLLNTDCEVGRYLNVGPFRKQLRCYFNGERGSLNAATLWRILQTEFWLKAFTGSLPPSTPSTETLVEPTSVPRGTAPA